MTTPHPRSAPGFVLALLLAFATTWLPGCGSGTNGVRVKSVETSAADQPRLPVSVYRSSDTNSAEVYLTDLDAARLEPGADLTGLSGRIVQIRMFIQPEAGSTPIATTACSVVVRHIVFAGGAVGVYSGGGFLLPSSKPGKETFAGTIKGATLRLTGHSANFVDPLGPATLDATFNAARDEALAASLAARVDEILLRVR